MSVLKKILKKGKKEEEKKEQKKEDLQEKEKDKRRQKKEETKKENREKNFAKDDTCLEIIESPWISEKSSLLSSLNQYVFKVGKGANKIQIKRAIEKIYNVKVEDVRIVRIPEKPKRLGRFTGRRPSFKKAIVRLKEGESIEITPK